MTGIFRRIRAALTPNPAPTVMPTVMPTTVPLPDMAEALSAFRIRPEHAMVQALADPAALLRENEELRARLAAYEPAPEDAGSWMQTFTGVRFFPMSPSYRDVRIADIAHALAYQCRYNGHVKRFYSVAEHCVLLSDVVAPEHALWALLHDATEAYVGDMIRPLKVHMPAYCDVEDRVMGAIARRFFLTGARMQPGATFYEQLERTWEMPAEVKAADTRILADERAALFDDPHPIDVPGGPLGVRIQAWSPEEAEAAYLARFDQLTERRSI